jgi:hypothetical protein
MHEGPPTPKPVTITVCSICNIDWEKHLNLAHVDMPVMRESSYHDETVRVRRNVSLEDCVTLLKVANQGPPGDTGAMGPAGMDGRDLT